MVRENTGLAVNKLEMVIVVGGLISFRRVRLFRTVVLGRPYVFECGGHGRRIAKKPRTSNSYNFGNRRRFVSIYAQFHNYFNHERHLNRRNIFKKYRDSAIAEWRQIAA